MTIGTGKNMLELLFTHLLMALAPNGTWVNYTITCLPSNVLNYTNGSALNCIYTTDTTNFPNFFLYIYIVLMICYFAVFGIGVAYKQGRRAFIGLAFLSLITSIVMAGAGLISPTIVGITWSIYIIITALVLIFG